MKNGNKMYQLYEYTSAWCGGLNKNVLLLPPRFIELNAWLLGSGTTWQGLGGAALVEELCDLI